MSYLELSENEVIKQELKTLRFCGDILEIQTDENNLTGRIIIQPLNKYYELLRRLREIERKEEKHTGIFII